MGILQRTVLPFLLVVASSPNVCAETLLGVSGQRELWTIPLKPPSDDFFAAEIVIRSPLRKIVTLENLAIRGNLVQVWQDEPTAFPPITDAPLLHAEWIDFDSHLLIEPNTVFDSVRKVYFSIDETNDSSLDALLLSTIPNSTASKLGIGDIAMQRPTDAFFFYTESQGHELSLARVVTPKSEPNVSITLGVLGEGCINCEYTFFDSVPVSFVAEPVHTAYSICLVLILTALRRHPLINHTVTRTASNLARDR